MGEGGKFMNPCGQVCTCDRLGRYADHCGPTKIRCLEEYVDYVEVPKNHVWG